MSIQILYNGSNPFGTRTPTISREFIRNDVNGYISGIERLTISGTRPRPSCVSNFAAYEADIKVLKAAFASQFRAIQITENANQIFYHPAAKVVSISIPETSFTTFYRYEITLDCFDDYLNEQILDPVNQWNASEGEDGIFTITHTVSARGIGDQAFQKARNFVLGQSQPTPVYLFLDGGVEEVLFLDDGVTPILLDSRDRKYAQISRRTSCNRLTGEFSMIEIWVYNPEYSSYGIITYDTVVSESEGASTVEISGNIQVNRIDAAADEIKNAKLTFDSIDFQAVAQQEYNRYGGGSTLSNLTSFSVNENPDLGTVSFTIGWDSQTEGSPYIIDSSTVSLSKTGGPNCFQYSGKVRMDALCSVSRFDAVKTFFNAVDWEARVLQKWAKYGTGEKLTSFKLRNVSENKFNGEITFSIQYCAEPESECGAIQGLKYSMNWTPSIEKYAAEPILRASGFYNVQDLGFKNRQGFSISGSARRVPCYSKEAAKGEIRARINLIMIKYFPAVNRILLSSEIEEDKNGDFFSFNFSWNADAPI